MLTFVGSIFLLCLTTTVFGDLHSDFQDWMTAYRKTYGGQEEHETAFTNWKLIREIVSSHDHSFDVALNGLADISEEDFRFRRGFVLGEPCSFRGSGCGLLGLNSKAYEPSLSHTEASGSATVDYRNADSAGRMQVGPVQDQGRCGSCYSFSALGALEAASVRSGQSLVELSEQQIVSCSSAYGNHGCNGGLMDNVFKYVNESGVVATVNYPYAATTGSCNQDLANKDKSVVKPGSVSIYDIKRGSNSDLKAAVAGHGPIAVAFDASSRSFQAYRSGVYKCTSTPRLDHAVLLVGYDESDPSNKYWIIKNSWGTSWGMDGYFKLAMSDDGVSDCGVNTMASFPEVAN